MLSTGNSLLTLTEGGSDMDEDYSKEIAGYILSIFRTNPFVVMSWGINPASIEVVDLGVKFHVQGFKHKGFVQIVLNEGEDLFEVTLISEEGETLTDGFYGIWNDGVLAARYQCIARRLDNGIAVAAGIVMRVAACHGEACQIDT